MPTHISPAAFARVLELARTALAGTECMTLTLRYGLAMPLDRLVTMGVAVELARAELNELEYCATADQARGVH